jgi:RpiR family carbohydrate utilization transcriptional regulator
MEQNALLKIQKELLSMSEVEKKIANYILGNPQKTVNLTMRVLAKETGVSEGSIINFANKLGFDGYTQLKINIAQGLSNHNSLIFNNVGEEDTPKDAMKKMMENAISSFQSTYEINDSKDFATAVDLIANTKGRIELYGVASSSMVAKDAAYRFMKIGVRAVAVTDALICPVSAAMLDEESLAIAISYTGRTQDIVKAVRIAKRQKAKTLCITSFANSPLASLCDLSLIVASKEAEIEGEATAARLTQLLLIDSICSFISFQRRDFTLEKRFLIGELMDDHYKEF